MNQYEPDRKPGIWTIDQIPAFCINMEKRTDRWRDFNAQKGVEQLPKLRRFKAVDGSKLDIYNDSRVPLLIKYNIKYKTRRSHEELSTAGGVGCALSHMGIWEWMVETNAPVVLIFEDDAKITPDFVQHMNQVIRASPTLQDTKKWDILNLANARGPVTLLEPQSTLSTMNAFIGMQCYFITLDGAKRFLQEANTIHLHIDLWLVLYKKVYGLDILCLSDYVIGQRSSKTDIQDLNGCQICNVKTDFHRTHTMVSLEELWLLRAMEIALGCTAIYVGYKFIIGK